jgi:hypothetical protein
MNTTVINLLGVPNSGKSTIAAGVYYELKRKGVSCELVREFVKAWAWQGRKPQDGDQVYIFGKQANAEMSLYGKVRYIVTDSPLYLSGFYESVYGTSTAVRQSLVHHLQWLTQRRGVRFENFLLTPNYNAAYESAGRFESAAEIDALNKRLKDFLKQSGVKYTNLGAANGDSVFRVLDHIDDPAFVPEVVEDDCA